MFDSLDTAKVATAGITHFQLQFGTSEIYESMGNVTVSCCIFFIVLVCND